MASPVLTKARSATRGVGRLGRRVLRQAKELTGHPYGGGGMGRSEGGYETGGPRLAQPERFEPMNNTQIRRIAEMSPIIWAIRRVIRELVVQQPWEIVADVDDIRTELNRWREIEIANLNPYGIRVRFESNRLPGKYRAMGHQMLYGTWRSGLAADQKVRRVGVAFDQLERYVEQDQAPSIAEVRALIEHPNDDSETSYRGLTDRIVDDLLVYDAAAVVKNPSQDGETIAELYDLPGDEIWRYLNPDRSTPQPPAFAYRWRTRDNRITADFQNDELIYLVANMQSDGYGRSGIESAAHIILAALKADKSNLDLLDHSVIPPVLFDLGETVQNTLQGHEWNQRFLRELFGPNRYRFASIWNLPGFQVHRFGEKSASWDMGMQRFVQYCIGILCMQYGLSPQDLGVVLDFHRTTAEVQKTLTMARGVRSMFSLLCSFLNAELVKPMTPDAHVKQRYKDLEDSDPKVEDELWRMRVQGGAANLNDWRRSFDAPPMPGGEGYFRDTGMGIVPVLKMEEVLEQYGAVAQQAMQQGGQLMMPQSGLIPGLSQEETQGIRAEIGNPFADMAAQQKSEDVLGGVLRKQYRWINEASDQGRALRRVHSARRWLEDEAWHYFPDAALRDRAAAWLDDCRDVLIGGA